VIAEASAVPEVEAEPLAYEVFVVLIVMVELCSEVKPRTVTGNVLPLALPNDTVPLEAVAL
jgi:hypothetical protein